MSKYFTTRVTGGDKAVVDRRVAELVAKGFELVSMSEDSETRKMFALDPGSYGPKKKFANDFTTHRYIAVMRRLNRKAE
ncbi:hypothetical protein MKY34_16870 [Sporosarcina sp. FSL K6-1522]|uniref:hypothetical protein n=1 Tax=Sporosarcina sp. FSL K6-1522 TaxID=2921554 RepID=UPI00315B25A3